MKVAALFLITGALLVPAYASAPILPSQAAANQGSYVTVEGIAKIHADSQQAGTDVDLTGPNNGHITGFIAVGDASKFPAISSYDGKTVDVSGVVQNESGRMEIPINRPDQLSLSKGGAG